EGRSGSDPRESAGVSESREAGEVSSTGEDGEGTRDDEPRRPGESGEDGERGEGEPHSVHSLHPLPPPCYDQSIHAVLSSCPLPRVCPGSHKRITTVIHIATRILLRACTESQECLRHHRTIR